MKGKIVLALLTIFALGVRPLSINAQETVASTINVEECRDEYVVIDDFIIHTISINRITNVLTIDGIDYYPEIERTTVPYSTVDYATAANYSYKIPWKGAVATATTIAGFLSNSIKVGVILGAINGVAAEAPNLHLTFTQYQSKEIYYSNYYNTNYRKAINKNVSVYKNSISSSNRIYGPVDGGWFDPIRP